MKLLKTLVFASTLFLFNCAQPETAPNAVTQDNFSKKVTCTGTAGASGTTGAAGMAGTAGQDAGMDMGSMAGTGGTGGSNPTAGTTGGSSAGMGGMAGMAMAGSGGASGTGVAGTGAAGTGAAGTGMSDIGTWIDSPGVCPTGVLKVDIQTLSDLQDATRGENARASDPANTCYFIHNGTYIQSGSTLPFYVLKNGTSTTSRRMFIGESRAGVIIRGRGTIDDTISHIYVSNLTFNLTGYSQSGSFNTLTVSTGTDVVIDHVTFTGDCATGSTGGAVEVDGTSNFTLQNSLVEKFGHCASGGHLDHGVYIGSGNGITVMNNEIRLNSSRGIQLNTNGGSFGTINNVMIIGNRIHDNGHADYEDGIVLNGSGSGTISNVTINHNLIYNNYYSGIRMVDLAYSGIVISQNTLFNNSVAAAGSGKSEMNLDDVGSGANTNVSRNIIVAANKGLNDCYDSLPRNYVLVNNVVQGTMPTGAAGNCVSQSVTAMPMFVNSAMGNFHTQNATVATYGAYSQ